MIFSQKAPKLWFFRKLFQNPLMIPQNMAFLLISGYKIYPKVLSRAMWDISMMWLLIIDRGVCCTNWDYWRGKENQWCTRQRMYHVRDGYPSSETHNGEKSKKRNRCNYAVMHSSEDIWQRWIIFSLTLLQRKKKIYVAKRNVKGSCDMDDMNRNSVMIWQCGGDICTAGYLWH